MIINPNRSFHLVPRIDREPFPMRALVALIVAIWPRFFSRSTILVHAFHIRPSPIGIASLNSRGYQRFPSKPLFTHINNDNNRPGPTQSSPLFNQLSSNYECSSRKKQSRIRRLFLRVFPFLGGPKHISRQLRRGVVSIALFLAMTFSALDPTWAAGNGRMGGSFGRSDRFRGPPVTRINQPSGVDRRIQNRQHRPASIRVVYPPRRFNRNRNRTYRTYHKATGEKVAGEELAIVTASDGTTNFVRKVNPHPFSDSRASDITSAVFFSALVTRGVVKRRSDRKKYEDGNLDLPLGPGLSVWSLTACLNMSDLNAPTSIVRRLQRLSESTSTVTREGLQSLIAETSLELSRQLDKGTVASVESQYDYYRSSDQAVIRAERQYNRVSTRERSKFDRESWSNYNGKVTRDDVEEREKLSDSFAIKNTASLALVQIHLIIEGNTMERFGSRQVETRKSLQEALVQLAGDVTAVKDCVVAGEVLWGPQLQEQQQVMLEEDVYANYPRLWPVDYTKY